MEGKKPHTSSSKKTLANFQNYSDYNWLQLDIYRHPDLEAYINYVFPNLLYYLNFVTKEPTGPYALP